MGQSIGPDMPGRRNGLRPRPGEPDNPGYAARGARLHIPLAGKVVITFRGQGSAGSIVGFEGRKKYLRPALMALFKILR